MYTADDIRKMRNGTVISEATKKKYTAEDVASIQSQNAEKGRELLRTEGNPPRTVQTGAATARTAVEEDRTVAGWLERNAPGFMDLLFPDPANDRTFAEYNTWLEQDDNRDLAAVVRQVGDSDGRTTLDRLAKENKRGWTADEINTAAELVGQYDQLPGWYKLLHRPDMSATGIGEQAIGGAALTAAATAQGLADLVQGRQTNLEDAEGIAGGLYQMGRDTYDSGTAAQQTARLGLTDGQETLYNLAEMTGENLAMGLINPSLLLMEMSARSAGEGVTSMTDQGRSAQSAALSGLGHGAISYAIEQAGIAQMMKNLGLPSGMSRAADALVDRIGSLPGVGNLSPWIFGTLASAGEEGLEEFTQTYADAALDQLLGAGGPGLLSGELLGEAAQSAVMGAAGGGILGALSGGIGQIRQGGLIADTDPVRLAQQEQLTQEQAAQAVQQEQATQAEEAPAPQTPASAALSAQLDALQQATDPEASAVPADPQLLTPQTAQSLEEMGQLMGQMQRQLQMEQAELESRMGLEPGAPLPLSRTEVLRELGKVQNLEEMGRLLGRMEAQAVQDTSAAQAKLQASSDGDAASVTEQILANLRVPRQAAELAPQTAVGAQLAESVDIPSQSAAPAAADYGWAEGIGQRAAEEGILGEAAWAQLRQNAEARNAQAEAQPGAETIAPAPAAQPEADSRSVQMDPLWSAAQRQEARLLAENSSLSAEAVELVVDAMPGGVSPEIYTDAARQIYQIARQGIATEKADALDLAQRFGVKVGQVMAVPGGPEALHQVWNQGRIEGLAATGYGRAGLAPGKTAGTVTVEPGAQLSAEDLQLIDLAARATDTAITIKDRLENGAGGAIDTALGRIYFAAEQGQDTLGTVLHEELHIYNALDPEGGRQLQQTALRYLAESQGFESVDRLIVNYVEQLQQAGQEITYSQAAEELVADAMRGVFSDVKSFVRWVKSQKAQAAKNAESRGIVSKTMDAVKKLLNQIIQKAKTILAREPDNQAARWAQSLAEEQRQELERLWYQHQDTALDNQRAMRNAGTKAADAKSSDTQSLEERYHLSIEPGSTESGKRAAAWEGADKAGLVEYMEQQRSDWLNLSAEDVKQIASKICSQAGSKANRIEVAKRIWNLVQYMNSGKANYDVALVVAEDIMDYVMQSSGKLDRELYNQYPDLHNFTIGLKRGGTLYNDLSATYGSYQLAQKELSRFHITLTTAKPKPGESVRSADQLYQELSKDYPGLFPADKVNPLDQIQQIATVREMITPEWRNNFGEGYDEAKADLALQLMIELSQKGGAMDTAASALRQRFSEALGGLRQNSEARMLNALATQEKQLRERYRQSQDATRKLFQETTAKMGAAYTAKLQRAQARAQGALQRARDARSRDSILRSMASDRVKLTRMLEHPTEKNHVPQQYLETALEIADLANAAAYNKEAVTRLKALAADIKAAATADDGVDSMAADYKQSGIEEMLGRLTNSMDTELLRSQRAEDALYKASRRVRQSSKQLKAQQQAQADLVQSVAQGQGRMTNEQLIMLHDVLSAMVTLAQNSNKLMAAKTNLAASEFAINAVNDVSNSPYKLGKAPGAAKLLFGKYQANVLNATRSLKRMGGYIHGGAMEILADALKNGEAEVIRLREKGAQIFRAEIENQKALKKFAGKNATLYDIGLKSEEGESVLVNMAQIVSIYKHLQHPQNREHLTKGGLKVPDMKLYSAGNIEEAYRKSVLAHLDLSGDPVARIEGLMDDYAAAWSKDLDELLNKYTKEVINRTSRRLSGYDKAKVENYYPIQVDSDVLAKEMEGVVYNGTIEGRGFLKERRQNAPQPILLEECTSVALRSLTDAATYGGLAPVIRDANKIWNANRSEYGSLNAAVRKSFGNDGVKMFEGYIADLQRQPRGRRGLFDFFKGSRGRYAGAVLTYNFPSLLGQISGVAALGSELGGKATWDAYKSFFEMATGKERLEAVLQEMRDHDFWAVENTMSTGASAELAALRNRTGKIGEIIENLPGANLLEKVDILTRASAWEGAKSRVNQDLEAYGLTEEEVESDAWWDAVAGLAGQALENTQPNYTISQQAAIQRNPDQLYKMLTMFRTPAFQNYGVLSYAIEDYAAQRGYRQQVEQRLAEQTLSDAARQKLEQQRAEYAAQEQAASGRLKMAVGAQIVQSVIYAVAAGMLGKDWLLHNLDREKDENGNFTALSVGGRLTSLTAESLLGNVYGLQEIWNTVGNIFGDGSSDPISLTGIDAISDFAGDLRRLNSEWGKLWAAEEPERDWLSFWSRVLDVGTSLGNLTGIPAGQVQRLIQGGYGWVKDFYTAVSNEDVSFGDILTAPESSSSQYDRLYAAAFENTDQDEVEAALGKLDQLDRITPPAKAGDEKAGDKKILSEMISREKAYGDTLSSAAAARIAGREQEYQQAFQTLVNRLAAALGIDPDNPGSDRPRLNAVIDKASSAISDEVKRQLGQDSETGATIYDKVFAALDAGGNVRAELEALRRAGIQDDSIRNAVSGRYKQAYIDGDAADRENIATQLLRLVDAEGEPYYTRTEMDGWASDAALQGFNESIYTDLDEALQTRNLVSAQEQIDRYLAAGKSDGSIRDRIVALYKEAYLAAQGSERAELGKFLCRLKGSRGTLITPDTLTGWIKDAAKDKAR